MYKSRSGSGCGTRNRPMAPGASGPCCQDSPMDMLLSTSRARCLAPVSRTPQPAGNGPPNFVGRIFLNEMDSGDGDLGLIRPSADGFKIHTTAQQRTGLGLYEQ